jgi:hypothetical protein
VRIRAPTRAFNDPNADIASFSTAGCLVHPQGDYRCICFIPEPLYPAQAGRRRQGVTEHDRGQAALDTLQADPNINVILLTGAPVFCAGADIAEMANMSLLEALAEDFSGCCERLARCSSPLWRPSRATPSAEAAS